MLIDDVERYIALRRSLGFKLRKPSRHLQSFACFAAEKGDTHIRAATAVAWAAAASTPGRGIAASAMWCGLRASCVPRMPRTRSRRPISSPRRNRDLFRIFTRGMNWPASSKPPASFAGKSPIRCGGNFM